MASSVKNHELREPPDSTPLPAPKRATTVFVPLVTPFLYGMERAVIELFDALRPEVEPYFLQSNRIFERRPPIIEEMIRRGFSMELLPDRTDWERLARPRSLKHLLQMVTASVRSNLATLKGVRGKDVLYVPGISAASSSLLAAIYCRLTGRRVIHHFHDLGTSNRLFPLWVPLVTDFVHNTEFGFQAIAKKLPAIRSKRNFIVPYIMEVDERLPDNRRCVPRVFGGAECFFRGTDFAPQGCGLLVKAFVAVAAKHPDAEAASGRRRKAGIPCGTGERDSGGRTGRPSEILGISRGCDAVAALRLCLRSQQSSQQVSRVFWAQRCRGDGMASHRVFSQRSAAADRLARGDGIDLRRRGTPIGWSFESLRGRARVSKRMWQSGPVQRFERLNTRL